MERGDLLEANGAIFKPQGRALNDHAADDVKVLITGNPANTNALIALSNAPDIPARTLQRPHPPRPQPRRRAAGHQGGRAGGRRHPRDHLGQPLRHPVPGHLPRPDPRRAASTVIDDSAWLESDFLPTVQKRGAAIIEARGASSAASAAKATIDHMHDWVLGTPEGDWVSMAVPSDGSYGVPEGIVSSFACTTADGGYTIVPGLEVSDYSRGKIDASVAELTEERDAVRSLGLVGLITSGPPAVSSPPSRRARPAHTP